MEELLALRERPSGPPVLYQRWRALTFLHVPADPDEVQASLPDGLEVETFPDADGIERAWIGFVPFRMEGIRPRLLPTLPGLSAFPETNVRTYVRHRGLNPGVWFYSLDATQGVAVALARRFFGLNYLRAQMRVVEEGGTVRYEGRRPGAAGAGYRVRAVPTGNYREAEPGTFEFWLLERYLLYSVRAGTLVSGRVHHAPYRFCALAELDAQQNLVEAAGLRCDRSSGWAHAAFSPGVDVACWSVRAI